MITLEKVTKSYVAGNDQLNVLQDADLHLRKGEFSVIAGPSGSGKSTLLNLVGCLDQPDSGSVRVDDVDLAGLSDSQAARLRNLKIGFIFQSFHLIPVLSAAENVAYPLALQGVPERSRLQRAKELLTAVGLGDFVRQRPKRLSGGQQQRVAIARALATRPQIVLADEPTANLDRKTAHDIMDLLGSLNKNEAATFLIATHDLMVAEYASRRLRLEKGKIVDEGGNV